MKKTMFVFNSNDSSSSEEEQTPQRQKLNFPKTTMNVNKFGLTPQNHLNSTRHKSRIMNKMNFNFEQNDGIDTAELEEQNGKFLEIKTQIENIRAAYPNCKQSLQNLQSLVPSEDEQAVTNGDIYMEHIEDQLVQIQDLLELISSDLIPVVLESGLNKAKYKQVVDEVANLEDKNKVLQDRLDQYEKEEFQNFIPEDPT